MSHLVIILGENALILFVLTSDEPKVPVIKLENGDAMDEDSSNEDGKQPSFCVLLHGSLKVEGMVAICHLGWVTFNVN